MSRRPARCTQADVARVIRAAKQCGAGTVEVKPDGTIRIVIAPESTVQPTEPPPEEPEESVEPRAKVVL
jgi:hypothetical protein